MQHHLCCMWLRKRLAGVSGLALAKVLPKPCAAMVQGAIEEYPQAVNTPSKPCAAVQAFQEDLEEYPSNGWSLLGLAQAANLSGSAQAASKWAAAHEAAWQHADRALSSPCLSFAVPFSERSSALQLTQH